MKFRLRMPRLLKTLFGAAILTVIAFAAMPSFTGVNPLEAAAASESGFEISISTGQCMAQVTCAGGGTLSCSAGLGESCRSGRMSCRVPITGPSITTGDRGSLAFVVCGGVMRSCSCRRVGGIDDLVVSADDP